MPEKKSLRDNEDKPRRQSQPAGFWSLKHIFRENTKPYGGGISVVHANGPTIGFPIYDLTAIIRNYGVPSLAP